MNGWNAFRKLTDLDHDLLEEASILTPEGYSIRRRRQPPLWWSRLSAFCESGVGVAVICCAVALVIFAAIVAAVPETPPVGGVETTTPLTDANETETIPPPPLTGAVSNGQLRYYFTIMDLSSVFAPGDSVRINLRIENTGETFSYEGFEKPDAYLLHTNDTDTIPESSSHKGKYGTIIIPEGATYVTDLCFTIPDDAPEGGYSLVVTQADFSQFLSIVLQVKKPSPQKDRFTFSYNTDHDVIDPHIHGGLVFTYLTVTNRGDAFRYTGIRADYSPDAMLIHRETGRVILGSCDRFDPMNPEEPTTHTVRMGDSGTGTYIFVVKEPGHYELVIGYGGERARVPFFLTVECSHDPAEGKEDETVRSDGYVRNVSNDGFLLDIPNTGVVFVKCPNADAYIQRFDTVAVDYAAADLIPRKSSYLGAAGEEESYSYRLEKPLLIRVADPLRGDPVLG